MLSYEGLDKNFRFMALEAGKQLAKTFEAINRPSPSLINKVISTDRYVDTLKSLIEKKCISFFRHTPTIHKQSADLARAVNVVSANLEKISDYCVNIVSHIRELTDAQFLKRFDCQRYYASISEALALVPEALLAREASLGVQICRCEEELDSLYRDDIARIKAELKSGEHTDDYVTALYVLHYLERMGDSLLNIGEAILAAITGENLKFHQYRALEQTLAVGSLERAAGGVAMEFNWETRSGSRIGKIEDAGSSTRDLEAIFKAGQPDKLLRERDNIDRWNELMPGLAPKVLEFREDDKNAALLLEYLDGYTFQEMILNAEPVLLGRALSRIQSTLADIWLQTHRPEPARAAFLKQALGRLEDVYRVHPAFRGSGQQIGSLTTDSLEGLLQQANTIDAQLQSPFTVLVHGDFNIDNIIYSHREDAVHFIDLYRSQESDYIQDVSVFMVSNYRMPIFETRPRARLDEIILSFYDFARQYAAAQRDVTFEARLALGLARSFLTSTRFELNEDFANTMFMRAVYLLETLLRHQPRAWADFELATEAYIY